MLISIHLGERLKELLKEHGSFELMEVQVRKWHKTLMGNKKQGQWLTRHQLATQYNYSKNHGTQEGYMQASIGAQAILK